MKLLFVDEFKENRKNDNLYGLAGVLIDNASYIKFKNGFYEKLEKLGWDKKTEIKGRYSFSSTKGDKKISVQDRLKFAEEIFKLSKSCKDKYASAKVFVSIDFFPKNITEDLMYKDVFRKIIQAIPKGTAKGQRNGNCNIIIFLDNNNALNISDISDFACVELKKRKLFLIERCLSVDSGNETPGIIFADFVAYFLHNYLKTKSFNKANVQKIKEIVKNNDDKLEDDESKRLINSIRKELKSKELIDCLKKITFIE